MLESKGMGSDFSGEGQRNVEKREENLKIWSKINKI